MTGRSNKPEVEGADEKARPQQGAGNYVDDRIIVAASQGCIWVRDDGGVPAPGWRIRRRRQRVRVVDATVDGQPVVQTGHREGQARLGEHGQRGMAGVCCDQLLEISI